MKTSSLRAPTRLLGWTSWLVFLANACVAEDVDPALGGGASGSGGASGTGGGTGENTGGSAGGGTAGSASGIENDPTFGMGTACPVVTEALITDFTYAGAASNDAGTADGGAADPGAAPAASATGVTFGDFVSTLSGGTFQYPGTGPYPVTSDVTLDNWHLSGTIGDYSGFGLFLTGCNLVDASAFDGISFTVRGNVELMGTLTFSVGTSENDISHLWLNSQPTPPDPLAVPNSGTCIPANNQYDGTCGSPSFTVPVTPTETTITVAWEQLSAGRPRASVDPEKLTSIVWIFPPPPGAGTTTPVPYEADVVIDDLRFVDLP